MTRPMTANLRSDSGSFKDPAGRVYRVSSEAGDARILRGLDQATAATLGKLLSEPFFAALVAGGQVVPTRPLAPGRDLGSAELVGLLGCVNNSLAYLAKADLPVLPFRA